ncbi:MAG TPA: hypothetical protein VFN56_01555 [Candidatus Saccharimonadales bacterium]|nr:hypothetical protein [Candidatus Saccharimonadales bacterium]
MNTRRLKRELRRAGSSVQQADELVAVAHSLAALPVPHLGADSKAAIAEHIGIRPTRSHMVNRLAFAGGLAVIAAVLLTAGFSGPGSHLYGVKGLTHFFHAKAPAPNGQQIQVPADTPAQPLQTIQTAPPKQPTGDSAGSPKPVTNVTGTPGATPKQSAAPDNGHGNKQSKWFIWEQPQNSASNWYNLFFSNHQTNE